MRACGGESSATRSPAERARKAVAPLGSALRLKRFVRTSLWVGACRLPSVRPIRFTRARAGCGFVETLLLHRRGHQQFHRRALRRSFSRSQHFIGSFDPLEHSVRVAGRLLKMQWEERLLLIGMRREQRREQRFGIACFKRVSYRGFAKRQDLHEQLAFSRCRSGNIDKIGCPSMHSPFRVASHINNNPKRRRRVLILVGVRRCGKHV